MADRRVQHLPSMLFLIHLSVFGAKPAFSDTNYMVMKDFDLSSVDIRDSLAVTDASQMGECGEACHTRDDCVAAIYDSESVKCYIWPSTIERRKLAGSGVWLITAMCPEEQAQVCCEYEPTTCGGPVYQDCQDAFEKGDIRSGDIYYLRPHESWSQTIRAVCEFDTSSGWTIFQRRLDGSVDFYRYWQDYVDGFGSLRGEYWIGLEALYYLTKTNNKASFYLEDHDGEVRTANYTGFVVGTPSITYTLQLSSYSGDAGDSLSRHSNRKFTTRDADHDGLSGRNCASNHKAAWWYDSCHDSNLNGEWMHDGKVSSTGNGIIWAHWKGYDYSLKVTKLRLSR